MKKKVRKKEKKMGFIRNLSIKTKLIFSFLVAFLLYSFVLFNFANYMKNDIVQEHVIPQFDERLKENGTALAESIYPYLVFNTIYYPDQYGASLLHKLDTFIKNRDGIEYVYVLTKKENEGYMVALNGSDEFMVEHPFTKDQEKAYEQKTSVLSPIYKDNRGVHKSFFVPIVGANAIIGIDMSAEFIQQLENKILIFSLVITGIMILLGVLFATYIGKIISKPLHQLVEVTKRFSKGDFSEEIHIKQGDEIGILANGFEEMRKNLSYIIHNVREKSDTIHQTGEVLLNSANELSQSSEQIERSINEEAKGAEERANHIELVSNRMSSMATAITQVDHETKQMKNLIVDTQEQSKKGNIQVQSITKQIDKIKQNGTISKENLFDLERKLNHIDEVITIIKDISSQIHLLSLNASIEAARAGEAGKGFSVVAQEVQKLATQTDESINTISEAINEINEQTKIVLDLNKQEFEEIIKGVELIKDNGRLFTTIFQSVEEVAKRIGTITENTKNINQESDEILSSIQEIAAISEQGAAASEEILASAVQQNHTIDSFKKHNEQLKILANHLQEMIQQFRTK